MPIHGAVLTSKGYSIPKASLSEEETESMKAALTVAPAVKFAVGGAKPPSFKLFRESPQRWYVPRMWGQDTYGAAPQTTVPAGLDLPTTSREFKGEPYDYQETIIRTFLDSGANGLICVPCGKGKTFMALTIAARLGKRFLVVVDKEFLMDQWRQEIGRYLPNARVGKFQAGKREIDPTKFDVAICMIQTICSQEIADGTFADYGFTIFDECHHLGAQYFSRTLLKIQTRHMLGLSATPDREDGLTKVFEWFLGRPVYQETTREPDPTVVVKGVFIRCDDDPTYNDVPTNWRGEPIMARLINTIVENAARNAEIVRWIRLLCSNPHRRVLVLSERITHLNALEAMIPELECGYYIGGMKSEERDTKAETVRVLLASYQMASEAMNIKSLNSVLFASPRKRVEQSSGRILRVKKEDRTVDPIIIDIVDVHQMYRSQWRVRAAYYKKCAYRIELVDMGQTEGRLLVEKKKRAPAPDECLILED